jgi:hypothetical protein
VSLTEKSASAAHVDLETSSFIKDGHKPEKKVAEGDVGLMDSFSFVPSAEPVLATPRSA